MGEFTSTIRADIVEEDSYGSQGKPKGMSVMFGENKSEGVEQKQRKKRDGSSFVKD